MEEFLSYVAPELAALLRVIADYLDEQPVEPDPEEQVAPVAKFRINERGAPEPIPVVKLP